MALLKLTERKAIFQELGLGEYNEKNIKAFQKKYMLRKSDADGIYGKNTDNTLRTVYYTKVYTKNFKPEEFRCECGGKYCCGYPNYMKPAELIHIQRIRDHYDEPITVTCGLRCKTWNSKLGGSIQNSLHMQGLAIDFFQSGVTDPLGNRKRSIKWIKKQPNHHYTYGNGYNSYGNGIYAPYMGNALHTDTYDNVEPKHPTYKAPKKKAVEAKPKEWTIIDKVLAYAKLIADDKNFTYVYYKDSKTCPICSKRITLKVAWDKVNGIWKVLKEKVNGKNIGGNCIWYAFMCWHHAGIPCRCKPDVMTDQLYNKVLKVSLKEAKQIVADRTGLPLEDLRIKRNGGKPLDTSKLKPGDIVVYYTKKGYVHTALWVGRDKIADCTSGRKDAIKYGVKAYTSMTIKFAIRYIGK